MHIYIYKYIYIYIYIYIVHILIARTARFCWAPKIENVKSTTAFHQLDRLGNCWGTGVIPQMIRFVKSFGKFDIVDRLEPNETEPFLRSIHTHTHTHTHTHKTHTHTHTHKHTCINTQTHTHTQTYIYMYIYIYIYILYYIIYIYIYRTRQNVSKVSAYTHTIHTYYTHILYTLKS
jgi:hypothetical protein